MIIAAIREGIMVMADCVAWDLEVVRQRALVLLSYFRQLVVGKIGESVQTQWHEHGSSGGGEAPGG